MPIPEAVTQGVRQYTIPASNAFGLPYPCGYGNPPAACQGDSLKPFWRNGGVVMRVLFFYHRADDRRNVWCDYYVFITSEPLT